MSNSKDIIGIVRGHQRKITENPWPLPAGAMNYVLPMQEMNAIAQALIIAVEALEHESILFEASRESRQIASEALTRIRSLPIQ